MFCTKCGSYVEDDQCYCRNCGKYLGKSDEKANIESNNEENINQDNNSVLNNSNKNGIPNNSNNNGMPNYPNNNGIPNYPNNNGMLNYPNNNGIPNYPNNNGIPNYPNNNGMPNYSNNNGMLNYPNNNGIPNYPYNMMQPNQYNYPKKNNKIIFTFVGIGIALFILIVTSVLVITFSTGYYFSSNSYADTGIGGLNKTSSNKKGKTSVVTDNTYKGVTISSREDAVKLVIEDSVSQKDNEPSELIALEDEIISKYGIMAVNFGELDTEFAKEVGNVVNRIYTEYPGTRDVLTNLSLSNMADMSSGTIAAFYPLSIFATSNTSTEFPIVCKTQVQMNASYFLNEEKLLQSVKDGSAEGHFPPNATLYSPVAHEYGHVLSFMALLKQKNVDSIFYLEITSEQVLYEIYEAVVNKNHSLEMLKEAYENYKRDTNSTLKFDRWRATISKYAVARDNSGKYLYDETIAEAFHDVYLNGENAKDASKYIVAVLKSKLEG